MLENYPPSGVKLRPSEGRQSGMFWSVRGANTIIALHCCELGGRFEDYWESAGHRPNF
jgi:hypothetical protein